MYDYVKDKEDFFEGFYSGINYAFPSLEDEELQKTLFEMGVVWEGTLD